MSLRIAVGGFLHETHSFAPRPTVFADFQHPAGFPPLTRGAALLPVMDGTATALGGVGRDAHGGRDIGRPALGPDQRQPQLARPLLGG